MLQDVVGSILLVAPSPHSDTSVGLADTVSTFVRKEDILPFFTSSSSSTVVPTAVAAVDVVLSALDTLPDVDNTGLARTAAAV